MSEAESDQDSIDGRNQLVFAAYERIRPGRAGPPGITNLDRPRSFFGYFQNQDGEAWLFEYDGEERRGWVWGEDIDWEKNEVIGGEVPGINLNRHERAWLKACWEAATEFRKDT
jgi:hypothetical protein